MILLPFYCLAILIASVAGGLVPGWLRLTHRWMECAVSLVAGVMLGVALLHLLPHALAAGDASGPADAAATLRWLLGGFLTMFFVERFFCFHHHDAPGDRAAAAPGGGAPQAEAPPLRTRRTPTHDLTWGGATLGLTLHSVLAGVALAASTQHAPAGSGLAGFGAFVAILLHKPFDAMTIAMLLERGGWSQPVQAIVNAAFAMAIPLGVLLAWAGGLSAHAPNSAAVSAALAFSAGVFLCISMSDLLPELQFHHHDRLKLSAALVLGLGLAWAVCALETHTHPPQ